MGLIFKWLGLLTFAGAVGVITYQYNRRFLDWLRFQSLGTRDYIVDRLNIMFIEVSSERVLLGLFAISFGLGGVVFLLCLPNLTAGFLFGALATVAGWKAPKPLVDWYYERRVKQLTAQMVDALGLMSNGLRSGLSIAQSMGLVTQEMPNPIQQEFNMIMSENKLGVSLEDAMTNLGKRVKSDDIEMFVTSINILKETGGNLAETFDTIVGTIRDRIRVQGKIEAMVAQGFYQGMFVMAMPPLLGTYFYTSDPAFMAPLFTTTVGLLIVLVIIALEVAAFFVIMKIIKIEV